MILTDCAISGNSAAYSGGMVNSGGPYGPAGMATLTDCTISGNSATLDGGGLDNDGTANLTNCTIEGNYGGGGGGTEGGGLHNFGLANVADCTISGNSAVYGGGLDNEGTAILTDTIVADNTNLSGSASDIAGTVSGTYNLIGTGGSGGLVDGVGRNIILPSLASLGLAPLGSYGGPTQTMALLPGSAAIGNGLGASGTTTDQRGAPRSTSGAVDIGAFQDQGYTLAVASGSPQRTAVSQAFAAPLVVLLTENFTDTPLPNATISFSTPSSGARATLSAGSAVTDASGKASVTATANSSFGSYTISASSPGAGAAAHFKLTNLTTPTVGIVASAGSAVYGQTVTFTATVSAAWQHTDRDDHLRRQRHRAGYRVA